MIESVPAEQELEDSAVVALRSGFRGELLRPGDGGYDEARRLWNGMVDKRPALIARCAGVADVVEAVRFAAAQGLSVAVRGGGHGVAGNALRDGALVVDLSAMKEIRIDPAAGTARAEAGVTLGELDRETQAFGLATPLGVVSQTGIAGLTLGGGIGWLRRKHGLSSDNLLSLDVVTADGRFVTASESEHADLFWGLRGGGGGLAVVTSFEYRLHPVGPDVVLCYVLYPGERAGEILRRVDDYMVGAPDEVSPLCFLGRVPHADDYPVSAHGQPYLAVAAVHPGPVADGERVLAPLRELGDPIADFSGALTYREAQTVLDADYPDGRFYYWKSADLERLDDRVLERLVLSAAGAPSHHSTIDVWFNGGAMERVDAQASAFGARPRYLVGVEANWEDPDGSEANVAWARETVAALEPFANGAAYLNFPGLFEEGEELLRASHGDRNYERLVELKGAYDPDDLLGSRSG